MQAKWKFPTWGINGAFSERKLLIINQNVCNYIVLRKWGILSIAIVNLG